jgi:predicted nucleotidyltransferase component of viral defense system
MLEILRKETGKTNLRYEKIHILREYLQLLILKILYDINAFKEIAFTGGTALRILHNTGRYSEDLDFSVLTGTQVNLDKIDSNLIYKIKGYNLNIETKVQDRTVKAIEIHFIGILFNLGLSPHLNEKLKIKLEIDSNPPSGSKTENHLMSNPYLFQIKAYDLASIFSGKLHVVLYRKYVKGRDYYDLLWFLSKKVPLNKQLFSNAVYQTEKRLINPDEWKEILISHLGNLNFNNIQNDVRPFLKQPDDAKLLTLENFNKMLLNYE